MTIIWRPNAEQEFQAALRFLHERNHVAASQMASAVGTAIALLERRPQTARKSRYPGFLAWSLTKWKKITIFHEVANGIEIAAFLDVRQLPPKELE